MQIKTAAPRVGAGPSRVFRDDGYECPRPFDTRRHQQLVEEPATHCPDLPRVAENEVHFAAAALMPDDVKWCRPISFRVGAYYERNTRDIGGLYPSRMCPRFTMPSTHRGERGSWDVFQVVVVECNVESWVLRDGNGSDLSTPDWDRRGSGRRRPTGDSGRTAHPLPAQQEEGGKSKRVK